MPLPSMMNVGQLVMVAGLIINKLQALSLYSLELAHKNLRRWMTLHIGSNKGTQDRLRASLSSVASCRLLLPRLVLCNWKARGPSHMYVAENAHL